MATLVEVNGVGPTIVGRRVTVTHGALVAPGVLAAAVPAREKKRVDGASARWTSVAADDYQDLRGAYLSTSVVASAMCR
jgi:hypothetical protein